ATRRADGVASPSPRSRPSSRHRGRRPIGAMMKALAIRQYKARMEMMELPRPEPGPGDLLVRVRAAGVNPVDYKLRDGAVKVLLPFSFPLILGTDLAGDGEAIGPGVTKFTLADAVYARPDNDRIAAFAD